MSTNSLYRELTRPEKIELEEELLSEPLLMFQEKMLFYEDLLTSEITFDIEEVLNTIKFYDVTELPTLEINPTLI